MAARAAGDDDGVAQARIYAPYAHICAQPRDMLCGNIDRRQTLFDINITPSIFFPFIMLSAASLFEAESAMQRDNVEAMRVYAYA